MALKLEAMANILGEQSQYISVVIFWTVHCQLAQQVCILLSVDLSIVDIFLLSGLGIQTMCSELPRLYYISISIQNDGFLEGWLWCTCTRDAAMINRPVRSTGTAWFVPLPWKTFNIQQTLRTIPWTWQQSLWWRHEKLLSDQCKSIIIYSWSIYVSALISVIA